MRRKAPRLGSDGNPRLRFTYRDFSHLCHGDSRCQCGTQIVVPIGELEKFIRKSKLSPEKLKLVVVFRLELQNQPFESSVFSADLLFKHVSPVL